MGQYVTNIDFTTIKMKGGDQTILVATNIKHNHTLPGPRSGWLGPLQRQRNWPLLLKQCAEFGLPQIDIGLIQLQPNICIIQSGQYITRFDKIPHLHHDLFDGATRPKAQIHFFRGQKRTQAKSSDDNIAEKDQ